IAAVVKIAMRARAAGLEMADPARFGRLANVEDEKAFGKGLAVNAAPTRRNAFQRRNHFSFGDLDLDGPSIFRAWNISDELRRRWIRDVGCTTVKSAGKGAGRMKPGDRCIRSSTVSEVFP